MSLKHALKSRAPDSSDHHIPARKRRKLEARAAKRNGTTTNSDGFVQSDALNWREVALPDRLEDAEGFLGLEEIEGVEVVKDGDGEGSRSVRFRHIDGEQDEFEDGVDVDAEAWEGFGSEGEEDDAPSKLQIAPAAKSKSKPKEDLKAKQKVARPFNGEGSGLKSDVSFKLLESLDETTSVDISAWSELDLSPSMLASIANIGFAKPTPIQSSAIPPIREGHDVIGKAVTGSGKTLAFGIPILEDWLETCTQSDASTPIALILAPTRELAHQLSKHLNDVGRGLPEQPQVVTVTGGLSILKQQRQLEHADLVIGTPGRLWEVINESDELVRKLKKIRYLVVDEADRLLSEGHFKEVEDILDTLDREVFEEQKQSQAAKHQRQTLVFSATFHKGLQQKLTGKLKGGRGGGDLLSNKQSMDYLLKKLAFRADKPMFIDSNPDSQMAAALKESIVECGAMEKDVYLYALALQNPQAKMLVFTNSISSVKRLTPLLSTLELPAVALHSTMPQKARLRSLEKFSAQRTILVATDVAARGLDIKGIDLIVHYHVPRTADMYVHRSGRTARAENAGKSVLLCSPDEVVGVTRLISKVHSEKAPAVAQIDRQIITKLQPRVGLSKRITDATMAKEKEGSKDQWLKNAADELGVEYDSDEFAAEGAKNSRGRGSGKSKRQKAEGLVSKTDVAGMRASLKELLSKRVNLGISERYLAGGVVDVDALLEGKGDQAFLGSRVMESG